MQLSGDAETQEMKRQQAQHRAAAAAAVAS